MYNNTIGINTSRFRALSSGGKKNKIKNECGGRISGTNMGMSKYQTIHLTSIFTKGRFTCLMSCYEKNMREKSDNSLLNEGFYLKIDANLINI